MGNVGDKVLGDAAFCQQECAARTDEYIRQSQVSVSKALAFDRNQHQQQRLPPGWSPQRRPGPGSPYAGPGSPKGSSPKGNGRGYGSPGGPGGSPQMPRASKGGGKGDDNPMREYRPEGAMRREADGPNWKSREGYVTGQMEDDTNSSFSPWAPEGPYAQRRRQSQSQEVERGGSSSSRQPPRRKEGPRVEDTQIGTGISEFLKRGVAQAATQPEKERPEMVPTQDGGFIATIQQGFQGIFGHLATSKEEVLKMRGPMTAAEYEAVPGDDIDQRVQFYARQIPQHLGECMKIYRQAKGEYEVSEEVVRMSWQSTMLPPSQQNPQGGVMREVYVFVDPHSNNGEVPSEPLPFYLRHTANVAYDLQFGSAMTKVPEHSRLSFAEEQGTLLQDSDADSKYKAMLLASEQAQKREHAAMEWRRTREDDSASGPVSPRQSRDSDRSPPQQIREALESQGRRDSRGRENGWSPRRPDSRRPSKESSRRPSKEPKFDTPPPVTNRQSSLDNSEQIVEGGLPPLPPLLPPPLAGPGGSFLLPPGAELNGSSFLMPSKAGYLEAMGFGNLNQQGSMSTANTGSFLGSGCGGVGPMSSQNGSFFSSGLGQNGSFYNPGLGAAQGSFLMNANNGSFLMTNGMSSATPAGNVPRTSSGVQVGVPTSSWAPPYARPHG